MKTKITGALTCPGGGVDYAANRKLGEASRRKGLVFSALKELGPSKITASVKREICMLAELDPWEVQSVLAAATNDEILACIS